MLKWLQRWGCFSFLHISLILSGSCDGLGSGTWEWILILRMRYLILHNTRSPYWSMWRMNTVPNFDVCRSINSKANWATILSPPQWPQNPVNYSFILMICPAMMKNTWLLPMWLKWQPDEAIAQHANWPPPGPIWIHRLKHQTIVGTLNKMSMITTPTQWRFTVHFGYWT